MKISVKNFGPIREAEDIEISPMTLFVGPSNTGKSYLATLIYSVLNILNTYNRQNFKLDETDQQKKKRYDDNVSEFVESIFAEEYVFPDKNTHTESQKLAENLTESVFFMWASYIKKSLEYQIVNSFGKEGKNLLEKEGMSIILSSNDGEIIVDAMSPSNSIILDKIKETIGYELVDDTADAIGLAEQDSHYYGTEPNDFCVEQFTSLLWKKDSDMRDCHYLPAIRGGIMQSNRALVNMLIEQAAPLASSKKSLPPPIFTSVLADFIRKLIRLGDKKNLIAGISHLFPDDKDENKIVSIGESMEADIMEGEIEVQITEIGYPEFHYKFKHNDEFHDLSLMNASSMVSELAPVSLFIRHYLKKGDFFIVEEPEGNLHPAGQRNIADILVQLVNAEVFVLVTTHSDNILEQISNSVHASKLDPAKFKALGENLAPLDENHSSSYSFVKDIQHGTTVTKIPFSPTTGLITKDHLRVSSDLYNQTINLLEAQDDD